MTVVLAIDAGTTGVRTRAVFTDGRPSVASYREFTQHFPQPGLGRARRHRDLGRGEGHAARRVSAGSTSRSRPSASPTSARPWWPGTGPRAAAAPGASSGRTGGPRTGATSSPPPATSRSSGSAPASCSTPTSRGTKAEWLLTPEDGGRRVPAGPDLAIGHHRHLAPVEPDRRRGPRHRPVQRQPDDALRHPRAGVERRAVRAARRAPRAPCPRCGRRAGASA